MSLSASLKCPVTIKMKSACISSSTTICFHLYQFFLTIVTKYNPNLLKFTCKIITFANKYKTQTMNNTISDFLNSEMLQELWELF